MRRLIHLLTARRSSPRPGYRQPPTVLQQRLRQAVAVVVVCAPLVGGGVWAWKHGVVFGILDSVQTHFHNIVVSTTGGAGLVLEYVSVEGREHTPIEGILAALGLSQGDPLMALDPTSARNRLEALPWVKEATVERRLPETVHIRLTERTPIALWQHDDHYSLVDPDGRVIDGDVTAYAGLPEIAGAGAPEAASDLFTMLSTAPTLGPRVKAAVRVGQRRWDLWVDDLLPGRGVIVHLPESHPADAIRRLIALENSDQLLERDIAGVDFRLGDRLVVQLSERAAAAAAVRLGPAGKVKPGAPKALQLHGPAQDT